MDVKQRIDWRRVDRRFERWHKANRKRFYSNMFTEDDIARSAYYAGVESALRKPPVVDEQEDVSGDRC